ncbi:Glutathione S-transferase, N-terminal [Kalmanozyma brasiliensis GHG001]|uniref:Glutathione S-transferase n=1 Tax=Kalmanozyma brasiliensis (strain GHG001) TaxID=1365824 RepID=V5ETL3_KALBG|nr:Glutathione S-transferase, N-terminal [Kalmanozyma brasiliensis GHG001]EST08595.1 Glutathione S-transferase, N-terminal [Kalmanozyma brasiliensis GHG001]
MPSTNGTNAKLTLYTAKVCPYAARAELALAVAGIDYETFAVDLLNKPEWYAERINAASKVPVLVSEENDHQFKLPESLVIVEYIHDLTSSIFTSTSPAHKATSRYVVERYAQLVQPHYYAAAILRDEAAVGKLREGLRSFNDLLESFDQGKGDFVLGEERFGYADLNIVPFVGRILSISKHGLLPEREGNKVYDEVHAGGEGFGRLKRWWDAVEQTEAWQKVWDEQGYLEPVKRKLAQQS